MRSGHWSPSIRRRCCARRPTRRGRRTTSYSWPTCGGFWSRRRNAPRGHFASLRSAPDRVRLCPSAMPKERDVEPLTIAVALLFTRRDEHFAPALERRLVDPLGHQQHLVRRNRHADRGHELLDFAQVLRAG